jgi:hypothetical protein
VALPDGGDAACDRNKSVWMPAATVTAIAPTASRRNSVIDTALPLVLAAHYTSTVSFGKSLNTTFHDSVLFMFSLFY